MRSRTVKEGEEEEEEEKEEREREREGRKERGTRTYLHFSGNNSSVTIIQRCQRKKRTSRNSHSFAKRIRIFEN
jgi:hypothetical protein